MATPRILPAGFDETHFDQVLDALADIVGEQNISRRPSHGSIEGPAGETYYGDYWPFSPSDERSPSGAIRPSSAEEVRSILRIANRHKLPLWTISRGRNLGYGGSAPVIKGSVVLDLHRMNRIIEVNEELAYAIVEPGVSFFDLFNYIAEKGYALWPSTPALGWGSVVGNTLDRGFGYVPAGEHSQQQCGMEVVLPTGDIIRTGMGVMAGSQMWPLYKGGYGPSLDGLFFQSNLGVGTKIGVHMDPAPVCLAICEILVEHEQELSALLSVVFSLQRRNVIHGHVVIANPYRQACVSTDPELQKAALEPGTHGSCATNATLTALWQRKHLPYWKAHFSIHGASLASVDANLEVIRNHISHDQNLPGADFASRHYIAKNGLYLNAKDIPVIDIPFTGVPTITAKDSSTFEAQM